ncbi:hypothetical protein FQN57_000078 [Myotisia sp. PD_48]|nr:hypothetical protein FQN57_000078 [Myotisia sp. PD_48]
MWPFRWRAGKEEGERSRARDLMGFRTEAESSQKSGSQPSLFERLSDLDHKPPRNPQMGISQPPLSAQIAPRTYRPYKKPEFEIFSQSSTTEQNLDNRPLSQRIRLSPNHPNSQLPRLSQAPAPEAPPPYLALPSIAPEIQHEPPLPAMIGFPVSWARMPDVDTPFDFLRHFNTVFLIDDSGSMLGPNWKETENALASIAPICTAYDQDGIDIYFLNHRTTSKGGGYYNITQPTVVRKLFSRVIPRGGTPTGMRLREILRPYLYECRSSAIGDQYGEVRCTPLNIIVITDGIASDDLESAVVAAAQELDNLKAAPWQLGIQFFQVGNEPGAMEELRELDDNVCARNNVRDIIDTVPWDGKKKHGGLTSDVILKVVLGAVHKKYNRRDSAGLSPSR